MMKHELARVLSSVALRKAEHDGVIRALLCTGRTRIAGPLYRSTTTRRKGIYRLRAPANKQEPVWGRVRIPWGTAVQVTKDCKIPHS